MAIPAGRDITIVDNTEGRDIFMSLDEHSLDHLMKTMTSLYKFPIMAVIREYCTNAWDSHVEAGNDRPIKVWLPTEISPTFIVKDEGVGMDAEDIANVYSRYGASSKRGTNKQNGLFGLGSKSALTYASQFTVKGIKNGYFILVAVSRSEKGGGVMRIVSEGPTTEPNGVEIHVPVAPSDIQRFHSDAKEFFEYWESGTVIIDEVEKIDSVWDSYPQLTSKNIAPQNWFKLDDNTLVRIKRGGGTDLSIVMGKVWYDVSEVPINVDIGLDIISRVPIGSAELIPSREGLEESERTRKLTTRLCEDARIKVSKIIDEILEEATDKYEAIMGMFRIAGIVGISIWPSLEWKGIKPPSNFQNRAFSSAEVNVLTKEDVEKTYGDLKGYFEMNIWVNNPERREDRHLIVNNYLRHIPLYLLFNEGEMKGMIVNNCPINKINKKHAEKVRKYIEEKTKDKTRYNVYVLKEINDDIKEWMREGFEVVEWADIKATKLIEKSSAEKPKHDSKLAPYPVYSACGKGYEKIKDGKSNNFLRSITVEQLKDNFDESEILYEVRGSYTPPEIAAAKDIMKNYIILRIVGNRLNRFRKEFPKARLASKACLEEYKKSFAPYPNQKHIWTMHQIFLDIRRQMGYRPLEKMGKMKDYRSEIKDLTLRSVLDILHEVESLEFAKEYQNLTEHIHRHEAVTGETYTLEISQDKIDDVTKKIDALKAKFPFFWEVESGKHLVKFCNSI